MTSFDQADALFIAAAQAPSKVSADESFGSWMTRAFPFGHRRGEAYARWLWSVAPVRGNGSEASK